MKVKVDYHLYFHNKPTSIMSTNTSFQRKAKSNLLKIDGTKPSLYNNQLLISTGIPSLDSILGGGIAIGTVMLVEEDVYSSYSRLMLKYFCAEAIMTGHSLLLSCTDQHSNNLLKELPAPIIDDPGEKASLVKASSETEQMNIAWRYQHLPKFQSNPSTIKFGHYYDLTKVMDPSLLAGTDCTCLSMDDLCSSENGDAAVMNPMYSALLKKIKDKIYTGGFSTACKNEKRTVLRIGIQSLGSPLWNENGGLNSTQEDIDNSLPRFLIALRSILRTAFAVCYITMPTHLMSSNFFVSRIEKVCDTVVHVDSFAGSDKEKNPAFKEYHGLFNIKSLPSLNSLQSHLPETYDLAFKLRRKKFTIEKLHLPPELSESASRPQEDALPSPSKNSSCGSSGGNKLDF